MLRLESKASSKFLEDIVDIGFERAYIHLKN
jgi:hypothetical protein